MDDVFFLRTEKLFIMLRLRWKLQQSSSNLLFARTLVVFQVHRREVSLKRSKQSNCFRPRRNLVFNSPQPLPAGHCSTDAVTSKGRHWQQRLFDWSYHHLCREQLDNNSIKTSWDIHGPRYSSFHSVRDAQSSIYFDSVLSLEQFANLRLILPVNHRIVSALSNAIKARVVSAIGKRSPSNVLPSFRVETFESFSGKWKPNLFNRIPTVNILMNLGHMRSASERPFKRDLHPPKRWIDFVDLHSSDINIYNPFWMNFVEMSACLSQFLFTLWTRHI